ncbi:hypothetical protein [Pedosphaera parvula]|nr:hypothetical protein [Pedosphaera parvula]
MKKFIAFSVAVMLAAFLPGCVTHNKDLVGDGPRKSPHKATINQNMVLEIDGVKIFHVGFDVAPLPEALAPNGKNGIEELHDAGANFLQTGMGGAPWTEQSIEREQRWQDVAAKYGMHCWVRLRELGSQEPGHPEKEAMLKRVVSRFKDHPGMGVWNSVDEPEWGKHPVGPLVRGYQMIHELDLNHPVSINQAPRGAVESLRAYNVTCDITGADIYPVSYPPGTHSLLPNKEISMVGDYTKTMMEVAEGKKPVWMYLQIAWSGVVKPGKTLRFPTFPEERFMTYQAIINGARGIIYFGGNVSKAWNVEDTTYGWNWHFWNEVLKRVVEEIGEKSPLYPALAAGNSKLPVKVTGANNVEYCVRETGEDIYILACKREGDTVKVEFSGMPPVGGEGEVMFESSRKVLLKDGKFTDWFAPFEVHVYHFKR